MFYSLEKATLAQLATLNQEIGFILSHNYYDFPSISALVADALKQLNVAKTVENNAKTAADQGDWQDAISQANKWQQAQNQVTEISSQIKSSAKGYQLVNHCPPRHDHG